MGQRRKMSHNRQKKIAVINDFCGFGRCSLAVSIPIISAMKLQCCPLPTALFSNHTGFPSFYSEDFTPHMERYIEEWKKLDLRFEAILSGFLGSAEQTEIVSRFFEHFKTESNTVVVDPVMGDNGKLYPGYSRELADKMSSLLCFADILTPNLTEATILTGEEYDEKISDAGLLSIAKRLSDMGPRKVVISGISRGDDLINFVYEKGVGHEIITEHKVGICRSGTGDVFSSVIAADAVRGIGFSDSVRHASAFIAKVLRKTAELGIPKTDGIAFEEFLDELITEK